jgi:hypothetical protein
MEKSHYASLESYPFEGFIKPFPVSISPPTHKACRGVANTNHLHVSLYRAKPQGISAEAEYRGALGNESLAENPMGVL